MKKLFVLPILLIVVAIHFLSPCHVQGQELIVQANTKTYHGENGGTLPGENVSAMWVQTDQGVFIKPLMVWSETGFDFMMRNWRLASGLGNDGYYEGVTSATRMSHDDMLVQIWDCKDSLGNSVPNGTYEFCVEMTETDYWWQDGEVYIGKFAKGSVEVGDEEKTVLVNSPDTSIYDFKAQYQPTSIVYQNKNLNSNKSLSYRYNPVKQNLTITLNSPYTNSAVLNIFSLNGELIDKVRMSSESGEFCWDLRNSSGNKVPAGVYLFNVYSSAGTQINKAFSITILR